MDPRDENGNIEVNAVFSYQCPNDKSILGTTLFNYVEREISIRTICPHGVSDSFEMLGSIESVVYQSYIRFDNVGVSPEELHKNLQRHFVDCEGCKQLYGILREASIEFMEGKELGYPYDAQVRLH